MTTLYNCRHAGDQYRITKFDADLNVLASYLCTTTECDCPSGARPGCRHRIMLVRFILREHIGDGWMYDHDRDGWVQMALPGEVAPPTPAAGTAAGTAEHQHQPPFSRRGL